MYSNFGKTPLKILNLNSFSNLTFLCRAGMSCKKSCTYFDICSGVTVRARVSAELSSASQAACSRSLRL